MSDKLPEICNACIEVLCWECREDALSLTDYCADHVSKKELREWCEKELEADHAYFSGGLLRVILEKFCKEEDEQ